MCAQRLLCWIIVCALCLNLAPVNCMMLFFNNLHIESLEWILSYTYTPKQKRAHTSNHTPQIGIEI